MPPFSSQSVPGVPNKGANFLLLAILSELKSYPSPTQFDPISKCYFAPYNFGLIIFRGSVTKLTKFIVAFYIGIERPLNQNI
jgi:hypothetical protein